MAGNMQKIGNEGGYDASELEALKEGFDADAQSGKQEVMMDVDPIHIQVTNETPVEQKEYEARSVIIEYDAYGEVVSVELL